MKNVDLNGHQTKLENYDTCIPHKWHKADVGKKRALCKLTRHMRNLRANSCPLFESCNHTSNWVDYTCFVRAPLQVKEGAIANAHVSSSFVCWPFKASKIWVHAFSWSRNSEKFTLNRIIQTNCVFRFWLVEHWLLFHLQDSTHSKILSTTLMRKADRTLRVLFCVKTTTDQKLKESAQLEESA
jgi:hypothetical protein